MIKLRNRRSKLVVLTIGVLLALGFAVVLFSLSACNTPFDIDGYKVMAKAELTRFATESNYCIENWSIVCAIVDAGKVAIDAAENKTAVDKTVRVAEERILKVETLELKIIWDGDIADIVDNETILITIDKNFITKEFTADDFKIVEIIEESFSWLTKTAYDEYISSETLPEGFRHIIIFKILDKGPQNLIDAIRKLETVNYVKSASPNSFDNSN